MDILERLYKQLDILNAHKDFNESCTIMDVFDAINEIQQLRASREGYVLIKKEVADFLHGKVMINQEEILKLAVEKGARFSKLDRVDSPESQTVNFTKKSLAAFVTELLPANTPVDTKKDE
jgi:hypothetical protein